MKCHSNHARYHHGLTPALVGLISWISLAAGSGPVSAQTTAYPNWSYTGNLNTARTWHTSAQLPSGKVLVAGGYGANGTLSSAELYDPATGTWTYTGNLTAARSYPYDAQNNRATLLLNGRVMIAGGADANGDVTNSAELYDPASGSWSRTGSLITARIYHTTTLLPNGKVLVTGGSNSVGLPEKNSTELYDPATGQWSSAGNLNIARAGHTATLLPNGKILVAGGYDQNFGFSSSAELYDPATRTWTLTGSLNRDRNGHTATLLPNGMVLVAGGRHGDSGYANDTELYDPATETWTITGLLKSSRSGGDTATLLPSGKVLLLGDYNYYNAELYDPRTGSWSITLLMNSRRAFHTATLLPNGKVLVAGGSYETSLNSAELYDPSTNPLDDTQFFVRQQYLDFLNREPDPTGLAYWTDQIARCGTDYSRDPRCVHERRIAVSAAFFIDLEFQDTGYYVYRFYKASFGRQPNYGEFTSDRGRVIGGLDLDVKKLAFADDWVQRPAFVAAYPITMSNPEVVNKFFASAGLTGLIYDQLRQQEIAAMDAGRSRALVLRDVIEIPDFKNIPDTNDPRYSEIKETSQYNAAFVLMQYFGYLRRDLDQRGYDFWLDVVNNRELNDYHGMVCSFITSTEYQLRFGLTVTRSNADCVQ